jgi:hypothetical protein
LKVFRLDSLFYMRFEAGQGLVPLLGNGAQVCLEAVEGLGVELEEPLATGMGTANDACAFQNAKVLGDGLAGKLRLLRKLGDGAWFSGA